MTSLMGLRDSRSVGIGCGPCRLAALMLVEVSIGSGDV